MSCVGNPMRTAAAMTPPDLPRTLHVKGTVVYVIALRMHASQHLFTCTLPLQHASGAPFHAWHAEDKPCFE